jgi:hypothetical protein
MHVAWSHFSPVQPKCHNPLLIHKLSIYKIFSFKLAFKTIAFAAFVRLIFAKTMLTRSTYFTSIHHLIALFPKISSQAFITFWTIEIRLALVTTFSSEPSCTSATVILAWQTMT